MMESDIFILKESLLVLMNSLLPVFGFFFYFTAKEAAQGQAQKES